MEQKEVRTTGAEADGWIDAMHDVKSFDEIMSANEKAMESRDPVAVEAEKKIYKWSDGIDLEKHVLKPLDSSFRVVLTQEELAMSVSGRDEREAQLITERNMEALEYNCAESERINERVLWIHELSQEEKERLYTDENTSDLDKTILACLEINNLSDEEKQKISPYAYSICDSARGAISRLYAFDILDVQDTLVKNNAHFRILSGKEREAYGLNSLEDITSAAIEGFVKNNRSAKKHILNYDNFLYNLMLDCIERKIVDVDGARTVNEELNLEEFQARVAESISLSVALSDEQDSNPDATYTKDEFRELRKKRAREFADLMNGRQYLSPTDEAKLDSDVWVMDNSITRRDENSKVTRRSPLYDRDDKTSVEQFDRQIRRRSMSLNKDLFNYSEEIAKIDTGPWVERIKLDYVDEINRSQDLTTVQKISAILAEFQRAFEIRNLDKNGESRPIEIKTFKYKNSRLIESIKKLFGLVNKREDKAESVKSDVEERSKNTGGFYSPKDHCIYLPNTFIQEKLTSSSIGALAHEMWHAKQHDVQERDSGIKSRMYKRGRYSYAQLPSSMIQYSRFKKYRNQFTEQEAYVVGDMVERLIDERHES